MMAKLFPDAWQSQILSRSVLLSILVYMVIFTYTCMEMCSTQYAPARGMWNSGTTLLMSTKIHGLFFATDSTVYQVVEVYNGNQRPQPHDINPTQWVPFPPAHEAGIFRLADVGRKRWLVNCGEKYRFYIYHSYKVCRIKGARKGYDETLTVVADGERSKSFFAPNHKRAADIGRACSRGHARCWWHSSGPEREQDCRNNICGCPRLVSFYFQKIWYYWYVA